MEGKMKVRLMFLVVLASCFFINFSDVSARSEKKDKNDSPYINPENENATLFKAPDRILSVDERMRKEDKERKEWQEEHAPTTLFLVRPIDNDFKNKSHIKSTQHHNSLKHSKKAYKESHKNSKVYQGSIETKK
jgi:hypothetical protein